MALWLNLAKTNILPWRSLFVTPPSQLAMSEPAMHFGCVGILLFILSVQSSTWLCFELPEARRAEIAKPNAPCHTGTTTIPYYTGHMSARMHQ
ncbi:hypothetical protein IWZ03DRAFT_390370 [Phyllosticta citriasiana]|uniref:Uncharacterized protein n=1 Tax=Phyllosticta citriasiana TaxID=595635 RepID=A0ABR1K9V2_9PEZI